VEIAMTTCELIRNGFFKTLIHFSSSEAYGTSEYAPMDENHPLNGTTTYAASKSASDMLIFSYCRTFGIDAAIIRPFNNYGPRQNEGSYAGVIPITIKRILEGKAPVIYGDGKQTRDYLYVTDTAKAAIKVHDVKATRNKVLNVASGVEIPIDVIIRKIADIMGSSKEILYEQDRPGDVRRHIANIFLAKDLIGFSPTVSFEDGLKATVNWYKGILGGKNAKD
jgi:UDP-glucose 4-epimerase